MRPVGRWLIAMATFACTLGCSLAPPRQHTAPTSGAPGVYTRTPGPDTDLEKRWHAVYQDLVGRPYRVGGRSPDGFDCSGLVQYAYRQFDGRELPRTTEDLFRTGEQVKSDRLNTGDLVFYETSGRAPGHVGIYLWSGWFLHAGREGVTLTRLDHPYYESRFLGARRL